MLLAAGNLIDEDASPEIATGLDPPLRIGLPSIDEEHAALFAQLDLLANDRHAHPGGDVFSRVLGRLGEQIRAHFDDEEEILNSIGMAGDEISQHLLAHDEILEEHAQLNIDLMEGKVLMRSAVLASIRGWILDHVQSHDIKISKYLGAN